jgi:1-acyl-sn-glycerol-3-phosphate acyltransferase
LLIFPEGTRSTDGKLQEFKMGVGHLLAAQKRVRAVPVFVHGAHGILPKDQTFPSLRGKLSIHFGTPVSFAHYPPTKDSFRAIAKELQGLVADLESRQSPK